jgi:hypothetical protein
VKTGPFFCAALRDAAKSPIWPALPNFAFSPNITARRRPWLGISGSLGTHRPAGRLKMLLGMTVITVTFTVGYVASLFIDKEAGKKA